ncbi:unnamed protein product, partial [Iphiclides podalirius]
MHNLKSSSTLVHEVLFFEVVLEYLPTLSGNYRLLYKGHTYWCDKNRRLNKMCCKWYCSKKKRRKCPASLYTVEVHMTQSQKGRSLLSCSGYTFYLPTAYRQLDGRKSMRRWYCSTNRPRGCTAHIVTKRGAVVVVDNNHNHMPKPVSLKYHEPRMWSY